MVSFVSNDREAEYGYLRELATVTDTKTTVAGVGGLGFDATAKLVIYCCTR